MMPNTLSAGASIRALLPEVNTIEEADWPGVSWIVDKDVILGFLPNTQGLGRVRTSMYGDGRRPSCRGTYDGSGLSQLLEVNHQT